MHANIEAATRVARIAAEYPWTWPLTTLDDLAPFCADVGWETRSLNGNGWLETDLAPGGRSGFVHFWQGRLAMFSVTVTDIAGRNETLEARPKIVDCFADLADALTETLGPATGHEPGWKAQLRWDLPRIVIRLSVGPYSVQLDFVEPRFQADMDKSEDE